jgi:hypothetical protein
LCGFFWFRKIENRFLITEIQEQSKNADKNIPEKFWKKSVENSSGGYGSVSSLFANPASPAETVTPADTFGR